MASRRVTLRIARLGQDDDRSARAFWQSIPPDERFAEVWRLTVDAWTVAGKDVGEPGLPRHTARVVRR
ncbi:MAG: hypothetical protein ACREMB_10440 [Candidatus Rokuibacteriota bacterium]